MEGTLPRAQKQMDEEIDDVKEMNKRVLFGKVATIREAQVEENRQLEKEYISGQIKID